MIDKMTVALFLSKDIKKTSLDYVRLYQNCVLPGKKSFVDAKSEESNGGLGSRVFDICQQS